MVLLPAIAVFALLLLFPGVVLAVPSPQSIGSSLTILTHNDLYGTASTRQAATIVLSNPQSHSFASSSCAALSETLWHPPTNSQNLDFLRYLDHGKVTDEVGVYWISNDNSTSLTCRAIDTRGGLRALPCDSHLPALCSQSASYSTPSSVDTGPKWRTAVKTANATIIGYRDKLSFRFLGLQYGSIPARFEHSQYLTPHGNVSALAYGPQCVQAGCSLSTLGQCSEACLFLNIWTPSLPNGKTAPAKKAVMLWIHGGGFTSGTGSDTTFDGGNMASRGDVVIVTINYRLSTLGFLALEDTTLRGNFGLADQITALEWIRAHIEDFGGDRDRIMVFGQSAGAASVRALIASPRAKGKFTGAIMQSNPAGVQYASTFSEYLTVSEATALTKGLLNEVGCTQTDGVGLLACLRAQDPLRLVGERNGSYTGTIARYPVVDGKYLTSDHLALDKSAAVDIAIMTGVMRDDGAPFSKFSTSRDPSQALTEQGFDSAEILSSKQFPVPKGGNATLDIFNLTARVATDAEFRCLGQSTAYISSANHVFPVVYSYEFNRAYQIVEWSPNPPTCEAPPSADRPYGDVRLPYFKCHSGDLYYVFGTLIRQGRPPRDEDDVPFSQYILDAWTAFGRERSPNVKLDFLAARGFTNTSMAVKRSGMWKPVQGDQPRLRILDTRVRDEVFREAEQCEVLNLPLTYYEG